jgi:hypothetical protein
MGVALDLGIDEAWIGQYLYSYTQFTASALRQEGIRLRLIFGTPKDVTIRFFKNTIIETYRQESYE